MRLRKLWELSDHYDRYRYRDIAYLKSLVDQTNDRIGEHTIVHADIHWKYLAHQIIVIGHYRNRDHVRVFDLEAADWTVLVDKLHDMEKNAKVGRFDVPHSMPFSVVYDQDRL